MTIMFRKCSLQVLILAQVSTVLEVVCAKHAIVSEECVLEFFQRPESRGQGLDSQGQGQDQGLQNCPPGSSSTTTCPRGLQHCSVVRTLVCSWRTFPDLHLIHGWRVTTLWARRPLWVNQLGQLSLPSLRGRQMSSNPCNYMDYGGGDH